MSDALSSAGSFVLQFLGKYLPAVGGALMSLRWLPKDSTLADRAFAVMGGVFFSYEVAPAVIEFAAVTSTKVGGAIEFVCGLFGMVIVGQIAATLRAMEWTALISDTVRKFLGLPPSQPPAPAGVETV